MSERRYVAITFCVSVTLTIGWAIIAHYFPYRIVSVAYVIGSVLFANWLGHRLNTRTREGEEDPKRTGGR